MTCSTDLSSVIPKILHANTIKQEQALSKLNNTESLDFIQSRVNTGLYDP